MLAATSKCAKEKMPAVVFSAPVSPFAVRTPKQPHPEVAETARSSIGPWQMQGKYWQTFTEMEEGNGGQFIANDAAGRGHAL